MAVLSLEPVVSVAEEKFEWEAISRVELLLNDQDSAAEILPSTAAVEAIGFPTGAGIQHASKRRENKKYSSIIET